MRLLKGLLNRRQVLAGGLAAAALPTIAHAQYGGFMLTSLGNAYEQAMRKTIIGPFVPQSRAEFLLRLGTPAKWLTNALVNRRRPEIDHLMLSYADSVRAVLQDVGQTLDPAEMPHLNDVIASWFDQHNRAGPEHAATDGSLDPRTDLTNSVSPRAGAGQYNGV